MNQKTLMGWLIPLAISLVACGGGGGGSSSNPNKEPGTAVPASPTLSATAALGEKIFSDKSLSASSRLSCSVCHDPAHAHAGNDNRATPLGGPNMDVPGFRNAPSPNYLSFTPAFFFDSEGTPTGGFDRDGRVSTLAEQAQRPFLAAHEMANESAAAVAAKLRNASYVAEFMQVFGSNIFDDS
ncbi:MAG TPA: cytochrome c peroxidase, partial [Spongiibacteraceae bacterium]|nr:cytochrome c peroxidase [Spongiibacteraceae bacterium]